MCCTRWTRLWTGCRTTIL
ncbi:unnamed protein product [Linum tenue]|uniref:Uncharacterized protein n=1 Tax=Linum tenue TaxID=586396 RepID=A0AAV0IKP6_9ROSI|nr:unnamed protein product [Linum tenue]